MPWKYNSKTLRPGKEFIGTDGTQYPKVWMRYSDSEKEAIGITWENPPASEEAFDNKFYYGRTSDGTLIPKSLADTLWVDEDGKAENDPETGQQGVTPGLKSQYKAQTKVTAGELLAGTDWMVIRLQEDSSKTLSTAVTNYRAAVRTASGSIETAIDNAADITEFKVLFDTPVDSDGEPNGKAPINNWPDEL